MSMRELGVAHTYEDGLIPAVQYVRMSTDHQRYSTENQRDAIAVYAADHGMIVIRTYIDEGKSGLHLDGRDALQRLIRDVETGSVDFKAVLVYDVSRWGRFQDADESAYYEYLCRRAGVRVEYCAEPFDNDGSPSAVIIKNVKRLMAGEYSRELSNKVFAGQCRLIELGFRQGGTAGFGLRRQLVDGERSPKAILSRGEQKSLQTDRVILIPGPMEELTVVQLIYQRFVQNRLNERAIADELNADGILTDQQRPWTRATIHQILTNEKYIGNNVYNRTSFKLKQRHVRNSFDKWIRKEAAFEPIVSTELFIRAREIITERSRRLDDETMLQLLRSLYERSGILSGMLIDEQEDMPSSTAYQARFGGLLRAYALIGFCPIRDFSYLRINHWLRERHPEMLCTLRAGLEGVGAEVTQNPSTQLLTVNDEFTVSLVIARCLQMPSGSYRWRIRFDTSLSPDLTVAARMSSDHQRVLDYYLFPHIDLPFPAVKLAEDNNDFSLDAYRFETLDPLYALAERVSWSDVA
jgi:DNA invertase Pin-like site-specific DNA recombinase